MTASTGTASASLGMGWQVPRLPGLGEVDWGRFIAALYRAGYDFVVSIEHEDRAFEGTPELVERGLLPRPRRARAVHRVRRSWGLAPAHAGA